VKTSFLKAATCSEMPSPVKGIRPGRGLGTTPVPSNTSSSSTRSEGMRLKSGEPPLLPWACTSLYSTEKVCEYDAGLMNTVYRPTSDVKSFFW
jgi:hypothetical protein